jgi:hypothetical protein
VTASGSPEAVEDEELSSRVTQTTTAAMSATERMTRRMVSQRRVMGVSVRDPIRQGRPKSHGATPR